MHSKRIGGRGTRGATDRCHAQERFPLLVFIVYHMAKVLTDSRAHHPRLWPVRAPDPGRSDLLSGQ